jgi:hypothetical protein
MPTHPILRARLIELGRARDHLPCSDDEAQTMGRWWSSEGWSGGPGLAGSEPAARHREWMRTARQITRTRPQHRRSSGAAEARHWRALWRDDMAEARRAWGPVLGSLGKGVEVSGG